MEANPYEWECNDDSAKVVGTVKKDTIFSDWVDEFKDAQVITAEGDDELIKCRGTLKRYNSKLLFSAKDKVKAVLINGEPVDLKPLKKKVNKYKDVKELYININKGDELSILASAEKENEWHGIIAALFFKPGTQYAKTYLTNTADWICGVGETKVIDNEDTLKYWDNSFFGARAIWEDKVEFYHKTLKCKTILQ